MKTNYFQEVLACDSYLGKTQFFQSKKDNPFSKGDYPYTISSNNKMKCSVYFSFISQTITIKSALIPFHFYWKSIMHSIQ